MLGLSATQEFHRPAELLSVVAYDPDHELFLLEEGNGTHALGFAFDCLPLLGASASAYSNLKSLLEIAFPTNTALQIVLYSSPNIVRHLWRMHRLRAADCGPDLHAALDARVQYLQTYAKQPLDPTLRSHIRDINLLVTVKIPIAGVRPTDDELREITNLRGATEAALNALSMYPSSIDADGYVTHMAVLLNRDEYAGWRGSGDLRAEPDRQLRDQVFDYDTLVRVEPSVLLLGPTRVTLLSLKHYPVSLVFGMAALYVGDPFRGQQGLHDPFMITMTAVMRDAHSTRVNIDRKSKMATQMAMGPILPFNPRLRDIAEDHQAMLESLGGGARPVAVYLSLALFSRSERDATAATATAQSFWANQGFGLLPDRHFCMPLFFNQLPFGSDLRAMTIMQRYRTMTTDHAAMLVPAFADWKGTGTPSLQLVSRSGQFMRLCPFESSNFNCIVAAKSGAGKSFFANYLITSYLAQGASVYVIDVGRSYEKLCESLNGQFMVFDERSDICLNPFPMVRDLDEEQDALVGLVEAMASYHDRLSDLQYQSLARITRELYLARGADATIDELAERLLAVDDERIQDVGRQLFPFTSAGQYGRFFNGVNNVDLHNRLVVLELEELKGRQQLQTVVLLQLIFQISQSMYLGSRDRKKIILIDEAWDLLTGGDVSKFIVNAYRRVRKYNGAAVVVTQDIGDIFNSPSGEAIANNSANVFLLAQKAESIDRLVRDRRLSLTEAEAQLVKSVVTVRGRYSEIYCITDLGRGVGRFQVDPVSALLFSTHPDDLAAIRKHRTPGRTVVDAIKAVLAERASESRGRKS